MIYLIIGKKYVYEVKFCFLVLIEAATRIKFEKSLIPAKL